MWNEEPVCMRCGRVIKAEDPVYVKLCYPKRKGFTEIKAYLRNEGQFVCEPCFEGKSL